MALPAPAMSNPSLLDILTSSSSASADAASSSLDLAVRAVSQSLLPSTLVSLAQAPPPPDSFDGDPLPSLLSRPSTSSPSSSTPSPATDSPLAWLSTSLQYDDLRISHAVEVLKSSRSDAEIQEELLEIWGFDGIEDMGQAVRRRREIVAETGDFSGLHHSSSSAPAGVDGANGHSQFSAAARDYTPSSSLSFATAEEVQAAKLARKQMKREKGKGRPDGGYDGDEPDVEEWMRRREEELQRGPGALVSGKRVRRFSFSVPPFPGGGGFHSSRVSDAHLHAGRYRRSSLVPQRLHFGEEYRSEYRRIEGRAASRNDARTEGGASFLLFGSPTLVLTPPPCSSTRRSPFLHLELFHSVSMRSSCRSTSSMLGVNGRSVYVLPVRSVSSD